ncbi:MAG: DUF58 domain-containing protein [Phycisphaerales bacterium]|nr:DUF58 domain-containing protein [Phycisphaerales bacterium]
MVVDGVSSGMHTSMKQGMAVEFAEHRPYTPGESLRHLDWKMFGRSDKLYIKRYQQETSLDVVILVDSSNSMRFSTLGTKSGWGGTDAGRQTNQWTKFDCAAAITVALAHLCLQQRDRVGLHIFSDETKSVVRRSGNRGQWKSMVQALATTPVNGIANFPRAIDQLIAGLGNRCLLFVLSDFLYPLDKIYDSMAKLKFKGHDLVLVRILDRGELQFKLDGLRRFEDLEGAEDIETDAENIRAAYLETLKQHDNELEKLTRSLTFDLCRIDSHNSVGPPISSLLSRREAHSKQRRST